MPKHKPGGGAGAMPSTPRVAAPAPSTGERTFWVSKCGDGSFIKLVTHAEYVYGLLRDGVKKLGLTERVTTLGLYPTGKDGKIKPGEKPVDNTKALAKAFPDATSRNKYFLVIKEVAATEPIVLADLVKQGSKWVHVPLKVNNEAEFKELIKPGLSQVRIVKDKVITGTLINWKDAHDVIKKDPDAILEFFSLAAAFEAAVLEEISNPSAAFKNISTGMERQHCFAFAQDPAAVSEFNHLTVKYDGRAVDFSGGGIELEIDSAVVSSVYLFVLRTKSTVDMSVVEGILTRLVHLQDLLFNEGVTSTPEHVSEEWRKYKLVPVLTGKTWKPDTEKRCHELGIITVKPDGIVGTYTVTVPPRVQYRDTTRSWAWHERDPSSAGAAAGAAAPRDVPAAAPAAGAATSATGVAARATGAATGAPTAAPTAVAVASPTMGAAARAVGAVARATGAATGAPTAAPAAGIPIVVPATNAPIAAPDVRGAPRRRGK